MKPDNKTSSKMSNDLSVFFLLFSGYNDYIGARVLISNNLILQGLTLASSAVEKYIKAYLIAVDQKPEWVHLDDLNKLKKLFTNGHEAVFEKLDEQFLLVLGKAYAYRYYDKKHDIDYIGVSTGQLLGELDYTVGFFENEIELYNQENDEKVNSYYDTAVINKDTRLTENNFFIAGLDKQEFMERPSPLYSLRVNPGRNLSEQAILEVIMPHGGSPYHGTISSGIQIRKKGMIDGKIGDKQL